MVVCLLSQGSASTRQGAGSLPPLPQPTAGAASTQEVYEILSARHDDWKGVRYQIGGLNRQGIDCSGLVQLTFRDTFGIDIPRTLNSVVIA